MGPTRLTYTVPRRVWLIVATAALALVVATTGVVTPPDGPGPEPGDSDPAARPQIVGGRAARPGEYPFAVAILDHGIADRYEAQFCGGSLIAPDLVLTAAHCVAGQTPTGIDVLVGTHDLLQGGRRIRAERLHVHPDYRPDSEAHDVAVVELRTFADDPTLVTALSPDDAHLAAPGALATTIGWGSTRTGGYPTRLRTVDVPLLSDDGCRSSYGRQLVDEVMVCAGYPEGGRDSCIGDSGGPLLVRRQDGWRQIGVVSWGFGCALPEFPGVYAELAGLRGFLDPFLYGLRDVPPWADAAISWLTESGYAQGFPDRTFRPDDPLTRAQAVRLLFAIEGPPEEATTGSALPFSDVPAWIETAVRWAARDPDGAGPRRPPMSGYPDGTFRPDEPMRRAAFSRLLWRLAGEPPATAHPFTDVGRWAAPAVSWMAEHRHASGWPDGTFRPGASLTRAQAARMLHRIHGPS